MSATLIPCCAAALHPKLGCTRLVELLRPYAPVLFSVALFKVGQGDNTQWFDYYAASAVGFIHDKMKRFPGCDFIFHVNTEVSVQLSLLHALYKQAHGRIRINEYHFMPRKRVAPWLIAAMRLAPLLDSRWRVVVSVDIHDNRDLQNKLLVQMIERLRNQEKEMLITYWIADDPPEDCMVQSPLPINNLTHLLRRRRQGLSHKVKASELHTHTDAGMLVFRGARCRDAIVQAHQGESFLDHLSSLVKGARTIPHGIEEMALDLFLFEADWAVLEPFVQFDVHKSVMVGATDDGMVRSDALDSVENSTSERFDLSVSSFAFDVGVAEMAVNLPCCRHSRVFDCEKDSAKLTRKLSSKHMPSVRPEIVSGATVYDAANCTTLACTSTPNEVGIFACAEFAFCVPPATDRTLLPLEMGESLYVESGALDEWALIIKSTGLRGFVPRNHLKIFLPGGSDPEAAAVVKMWTKDAPAPPHEPPGWRVAWSSAHRRWYYWTDDGKTSWNVPVAASTNQKGPSQQQSVNGTIRKQSQQGKSKIKRKQVPMKRKARCLAGGALKNARQKTLASSVNEQSNHVRGSSRQLQAPPKRAEPEPQRSRSGRVIRTSRAPVRLLSSFI